MHTNDKNNFSYFQKSESRHKVEIYANPESNKWIEYQDWYEAWHMLISVHEVHRDHMDVALFNERGKLIMFDITLKSHLDRWFTFQKCGSKNTSVQNNQEN